MTHLKKGRRHVAFPASKRLPARQRRRRHRLLSLECLESRQLLADVNWPVYDDVNPSWFETVPHVFVGEDAMGGGMLSGASAATEPVGESRNTWGSWIVRLTASASHEVSSLREAERFLDTITADFQVIRGLGLPGQMRVRGFAAREAARAALSSNPHVAYFEAESRVQAQVIPEDARFGEMWNLRNTGQTGRQAPTSRPLGLGI